MMAPPGRWLGVLGVLLAAAACTREPPPERHAPPPAPKPVGVSVPASFAGELPCADCAVLHATLTLRRDGLFLLRSDSRGRASGGDGALTRLGTWRQQPDRARLLLQTMTGPLDLWEIVSPWRLRRLDRSGNPIRSQEPYELERAAELDAHDDVIDLSGMYDGWFEECGSGRRWTVAEEADKAALDRAYGAVPGKAGAALRVALSGHFAERPRPEGGGTQEVIVVDHFQELYPDADCTTTVTPTSLEDRDWTVVELEGRSVAPGTQTLRLVSGAQRLRAAGGCSRLSGDYRLNNGTLRVDRLTPSGGACRPDAAMRRVLRETRSYRLEGSRLELLAGSRVLGRLEPAPIASRRE